MPQSRMPSQPAPPHLHFRVPPEPSHLLRARDRVRDYLRQYCAASELIDDVVLCVEEAATNAIRHSGSEQDIELSLRVEGGDLVAEVKDHGRGFEIAAFDPEALPDLQALGGRGLFLIASLTDKLELSRDGGIEVRMVKKAVACRAPLPLESALGDVRTLGDADYRDVRLRALLEEIDEAFLALDWEYRYVHANRVAQRMADMSLEELVGRRPWEVVPTMAGTPLEQAFRDAMELGTPSVLEHQSVVSGNWLEVRVYPTPAGISAYFRDISERKRTELERDALFTALRESEERFRLVLRDAPVSVSAQDRDLRYVWAYNQRSARPEEIIGKLDVDIFTPEEAERLGAIKRRVLEEDVEILEQMWLERPGGRMFLEVNFEPIHDESGRVTGVGTATVDLTPMKLAEEALRESRAKLEAALASMTDAVFISDSEGRFIDFNDAFATFHRFGNKEECATTLVEYPDFLDVFMADGEPAPLDQSAVPRALRGETVTDAEYTLRRKDTGETWVGSYSFGPIRDHEGEIVGSVVIGRDITERKRLEEALRDAEERSRDLIRYAPTGIYEIDFRGPSFRSVNDAMCVLTGYGREELLAMNPLDLLDAESQAVFLERIARSRAGDPIPEYVEYHTKTKDGRLRDVVLNVSFTYTDGVIDGALVVGHDVTERKQAEEELRGINEELERFNRAMVGRELRMVELKREVNRFCAQAGLPPRYALASQEDEP